MTIDEASTKVENFVDNINLYINNSVNFVKDYIIELQIDQLWEGRRSDDSIITPLYKELTVKIKKEKGQPVDRVTLKDTGSFYDKIFVKPEKGESILIESEDNKNEKIVKKYGEKIFGINKYNTIDVGIKINEKLIELFIEKTGF